MTEFEPIINIKMKYLHYAQATSSIDRCAECRKPYPCPTMELIRDNK